MLKYEYFAHTSPEGISPWYWIKHAGYSYIYAGENLAIDFISTTAVHKAWMASSGHRANILNSHYKDIGISVVSGNFKGRNTTVIAQMFGSTYYSTSPRKSTKKSSPPKNTSENPAPEKSSKNYAYQNTSANKPNSQTQTNIQPIVPKITSLKENAFINSERPYIVGTASPNTTVQIIIDNEIREEVKVGSKGNFSFILKNTLKDGPHDIVAYGISGKNKSKSSDKINFTIDTDPPIIYDSKLLFIPSFDNLDKWNLYIEVGGDPSSIWYENGEENTTGTKVNSKSLYKLGVLKEELPTTKKPTIKIGAKDLAGNIASQEINLPAEAFYLENSDKGSKNPENKKETELISIFGSLLGEDPRLVMAILTITLFSIISLIFLKTLEDTVPDIQKNLPKKLAS